VTRKSKTRRPCPDFCESKELKSLIRFSSFHWSLHTLRARLTNYIKRFLLSFMVLMMRIVFRLIVVALDNVVVMYIGSQNPLEAIIRIIGTNTRNCHQMWNDISLTIFNCYPSKVIWSWTVNHTNIKTDITFIVSLMTRIMIVWWWWFSSSIDSFDIVN
jgi:hypothetical protein